MSWSGVALEAHNGGVFGDAEIRRPGTHADADAIGTSSARGSEVSSVPSSPAVRRYVTGARRAHTPGACDVAPDCRRRRH